MTFGKRKVLISYPLTRTSPLYPGNPPVTFQPTRAISRGDSSNSTLITMSNHSGTHVDLPLHFCDGGPSALELLSAEQTFSPVYCVDLSGKTNFNVVTPDDFPHPGPKMCKAEAILVRTGMTERRDTPSYIQSYPFVDPRVPSHLRSKFPYLKIFCIDTLSVSNPAYREDGRLCHRNFLCENPPIMIMEDVRLQQGISGNGEWSLKVYPHHLDKLDAVPVTAILEQESS